MLSGASPHPVEDPILTQFAWISAPTAGLCYSQIQPGQNVQEGQVGAVIKDVFGEVIENVLVPQDGLVLFAVTSLAINAGDPVFAVAAP